MYRKQESLKDWERKNIHEENISYKLVIAFLIKANCSQLGEEEEGKAEEEVETSQHLLITTKRYKLTYILLTGEVFGNYQQSKIGEKVENRILYCTAIASSVLVLHKKINTLFSAEFQMVSCHEHSKFEAQYNTLAILRL